MASWTRSRDFEREMCSSYGNDGSGGIGGEGIVTETANN